MLLVLTRVSFLLAASVCYPLVCTHTFFKVWHPHIVIVMDVKGVKVDQLSGHWLATGTRLTLVKRLCQLNPPLPPTCSATSPPGQCLFMFVELGLFMTSWKYLKNLAQFVLGSNKHVCTLLICAWYVCTYTTYRCQVFLCVCVWLCT